MRKFLFAATILVPITVAPAFAEMPRTQTTAADVNRAKTTAGSDAGVSSQQETMAGAKIGGSGAVIVGAVSGNYTSVETGAGATAGPKGSFTNTNAKQTNIGGTVAGGIGSGASRSSGAFGKASGDQISQASGDAAATASNKNVGGFVTGVQVRGGHSSGR
jgi:hypothetical protein